MGEGTLHQLLNIHAGPGLPHLSFEEIQIPHVECIIISMYMHRWIEMSMPKPGLLCWSGKIVLVDVLTVVVEEPLPGMLEGTQNGDSYSKCHHIINCCMLYLTISFIIP